jgi:hypothetical protein
MNCVCPKPAALTTVAKVTCKENLYQIQRVIIQRAGFQFDAPATDIKLLASWTPLFIAADDTKVISTPYIEGLVIPTSEPVTEGGGDNSTIDGREIVLGGGPITVTGMIAEAPASVIEALQKIACEVDLVGYFINQYGNIICREVTAGDKYEGIPIYSPFISDAGNEGLNTRDKATIRFALDYGWRTKLAILTPTDFNAKTALWPA